MITPLFNLFSMEGLIILLLAILMIMIMIIHDKRKNRAAEAAQRRLLTMDEILSKYGEPDNMVVVDPTCGNEASGTVMEYKSLGLLVVEGDPIEKAHIKDVSFSNYAMAFAPNHYMIILLTEIPEKSVIRLPLGAGNDARYADQVVQDIRALLREQR